MRKPIWRLREGLRLWMWSRQRDTCGDGPFIGFSDDRVRITWRAV